MMDPKSDAQQALGLALDRAISETQSFRDTNPLPSLKPLDKVMQGLKAPICAGKWLLGNKDEESAYFERIEKEKHEEMAASDSSSEVELNLEDLCHNCLEPGLLIICDHCDRQLHQRCANLDHVPAPEEEWLCALCRLGQTKSKAGDEEDLDAEDLNAGSEGGDGQDALNQDFVTIGPLRTTNPHMLGIPDGQIRMADGDLYHIAHYLGDEYVQLIHQLYQQKPIPCPPYMTTAPHEYQLKGAAQIHYACEGPFRGLVLGDEPGLGKTIQGILAMHLVRNEPGMSLVVSPASLCTHWLDSIERWWEEGHALRAMILRDSKITATQLLELKLDVVICSYEFVESSVRRAAKQDEAFTKLREQARKGINVKPPVRPTASLFSEVYRMTGLDFKRLILDETQVVSNAHQARHLALKEIPAEAILCLTGTPTHNKWYALFGYIDFMRGHPFTSVAAFLQAFGGKDGRYNQPGKAERRLLQRFLQTIIIARPKSTHPALNLGHRRVYDLHFKLDELDKSIVEAYTKKYRKILRKNQLDPDDLFNGTGGQSHFGKKCFLYATKARLASAALPLLLDFSRLEDTVQDDNGSEADLTEDATLEETLSQPSRRLRLNKVLREHPNLADSKRLEAVHEAYLHCRTVAPDSKIVIFSQFLGFLDAVAIFLEAHEIATCRFDGSVKVSDRPKVQNDFENAAPEVPLLISAGAGGTGLNLQCASMVIQCEIWWNHNNELQALCRCDRQGQTKTVHYIQLFAVNSEIDHEIRTVQQRKTKINERLMRPLIRTHKEGPDIRGLLTHVPLQIRSLEDNLPSTHGKMQTP